MTVERKSAKVRMAGGEKRPLVAYCALAYVITWALWIPALMRSASTGFVLPTIDQGLSVWFRLSGIDLVFAVMFQLAVYGPVLAALIILIRMRERSALEAWGKAIIDFRVAPRWYLFVAAWPLALAAIVTVAGVLTGGGMPRWQALPSLSVVVGLLIAQLLTSGLEEPGWRGFALPLLQRSHNAEAAGWYLGLIWAGWHLPFMLYLCRGIPAWSIPLTLAGFTMSIIAMGFVHAWLYNSTGSVAMNILLHGWSNAANALVVLVMPSPVVPLATAGATWIFVVWLEKRYGKERLSARGDSHAPTNDIDGDKPR